MEKNSQRTVLLNEIDRIFPHPVETYRSVYERGQLTKKYIKKYIADNEINTGLLKIGIISHHAFFNNFTSAGIDENDRVIKGLSFNNCEIIRYDL